MTNIIEDLPKKTCIFRDVPDERNSLKKNQRAFKCHHGKVLSWQTARRVLGLPAIPERLENENSTSQVT